MIYAKAVAEPLYKFAQMAFANKTEQMRELTFSHSAAQRLFKQIEKIEILPIKDALLMPDPEMRAFYELTMQYITFLMSFPDLPFPPDFLTGTNDLQLGGSLLRYFVERKFPFPQKLPQ